MPGVRSRDENRQASCWDINGSWKPEDLVKAMARINETHNIMQEMVQHTKHLPKIAESNEDIKVYLMNAVTGRNHVPVEVVKTLVRIGGWVIFGLTSVIVFILTGSKFGLFPNLH